MIYKPNFFVITGDPVLANDLIGGVSPTRFSVCSRNSPGDYPGNKSPETETPSLGQIYPLTPTSCFPCSVESFKQHQKTGICSFLRPGYPRHSRLRYLTHQSPSPELQHAVQDFRYNPRVFILPPWPEIYETDSERKTNLPRSHRNLRYYARYLPTT